MLLPLLLLLVLLLLRVEVGLLVGLLELGGLLIPLPLLPL